MYTTQAARDAYALKGQAYADYIEDYTLTLATYYRSIGLQIKAERIIGRSLGEALSGHDGD